MDIFSITSPFIEKFCDGIQCVTTQYSISITDRDLILGSIFFVLGIFLPTFIYKTETKKYTKENVT